MARAAAAGLEPRDGSTSDDGTRSLWLPGGVAVSEGGGSASAWRAREERRAYRRLHGAGEHREGGESLGARLAGALVAGLFAVAAFVLRVLPREVAVEIGAALGTPTAFLFWKRRRIALANLALAFPEKTPRERARIATRSFEEAGRTFVEVIRLPLLTRREIDRTVEIVDAHHWTGLDRKQGVIALSAHLGFFEGIAAIGSVRLGRPTSIVGRQIKPFALDAIVRGLRASCGVDTISNKDAVREVLRRLAEGEGIGVVLDQNMKRGTGVFVPFFGRLASTTPGLAILARRSGAPVLPIFIERRGSLGRHRLVFKPPLVWDDAGGDSKAAIVANTALYTRIIEEEIRRRPAEWFWFHDRWRTRPPEEKAEEPPEDADAG